MLSCPVSIMAADILVMQRARTSVAMLLTWLSQNNLISAPEELISVEVLVYDYMYF